MLQLGPGGRIPVRIQPQQGNGPRRCGPRQCVFDLAFDEMDVIFGIPGEQKVAADLFHAVIDPGGLPGCIASFSPTAVRRFAKSPAIDPFGFGHAFKCIVKEKIAIAGPEIEQRVGDRHHRAAFGDTAFNKVPGTVPRDVADRQFQNRHAFIRCHGVRPDFFQQRLLERRKIERRCTCGFRHKRPHEFAFELASPVDQDGIPNLPRQPIRRENVPSQQ